MNRYPDLRLPGTTATSPRPSPVRVRQAQGLSTKFTPSFPIGEPGLASPSRRRSPERSILTDRPILSLSPTRTHIQPAPRRPLVERSPERLGSNLLDLQRSARKRKAVAFDAEIYAPQENHAPQENLGQVVADLQQLVKSLQADHSRKLTDLQSRVDAQDKTIEQLQDQLRILRRLRH